MLREGLSPKILQVGMDPDSNEFDSQMALCVLLSCIITVVWYVEHKMITVGSVIV